MSVVQMNLSVQLQALGLPGDLAETVLQAIDAAGYSVVHKAGGQPAEGLAAAGDVQRVSLGPKVPGGFLVSVQLPGNGWLVWTELQCSRNTMHRSNPVHVPASSSEPAQLFAS